MGVIFADIRMDQHDSDDDFVSDKKSSKGKSQESEENLANFNFPSGHCFGAKGSLSWRLRSSGLASQPWPIHYLHG